MKHLSPLIFFVLGSHLVSAQSVGIGTRSPNYTLTVKDSTGTANNKGFAQVSPDGTTALGTYVSNGSAYIQTHTNHDLNFTTNDGPARMTLQKGSGNLGIGTSSPAARLHVTDSAVLFSGNYSYNANPAPPPVEGAGIRMMWYPQKVAFRAGYVSDTAWDKNNIGNFSAATGYNTRAKGESSFATGENAVANGYTATAMGRNTQALGQVSFATGSNTVAKALYATVMGHYNDVSDNPDGLNLVATDRIFQVGNGTASSRSNALTILRNGNVGIGDITPAEKLEVNGNAIVSGNATVGGTLKISGGTPGAGKLLTSDASGNASWQTPALPPSIATTGFFAAIDGNQLTPIASGAALATIPFNDTYAATLSSSAFDDGSNFSTSGIYTVPSTGFYHFEWAVRFIAANASQNGVILIAMRKNAASHSSWRDNVYSGQPVPQIDGSINVKLQAGDQISFTIYQTSGQPLTYFNTDDTRLSGYRIY